MKNLYNILKTFIRKLIILISNISRGFIVLLTAVGLMITGNSFCHIFACVCCQIGNTRKAVRHLQGSHLGKRFIQTVKKRKQLIPDIFIVWIQLIDRIVDGLYIFKKLRHVCTVSLNRFILTASGKNKCQKQYRKQETLSGEFMKIVNEYHKSLSLRYYPFIII